MSGWEKRGDTHYRSEGAWEYLIHRADNMWRLAERHKGDVEWSTVTLCHTIENAMRTQQ